MSHSLLWVELIPSPRPTPDLSKSPAKAALFGNGVRADGIELRGGHAGLGLEIYRLPVWRLNV